MSSPARLCILVLLVATSSCTPRDIVAPTPPRPVVDEDHLLLQRAIASLIDETERTRELELREPVEAVTMSQDELRALVQAQVAETDMTVAQRIMQAFGFIPDGLDLGVQMVDLLSEEVLGMYDQDEDRLIVLRRVARGLGESTIEAMMARMVLVHELTHALQDQHFDTLDHTGEEVWSDDEQSVYSCLAEGDATLTMFVSTLRQKGLPVDPTLHPSFRELLRAQGESALPQSQAMSSAPPYFGHVLSAIYLEGAGFMAELRRLGGWRAVDAAHRNRPRATRDILHIEHYLSGRGIFEVELPAPLPGLEEVGYERVASAVLGELETGAYLLPLEDSERLRSARDGWAGDRFAVYVAPQGQLALVWRIRFEDVEDATEFFEAAHEVALATGRGPCEETNGRPDVEAEGAQHQAPAEQMAPSTDARAGARVVCHGGRDVLERRGADVVILRDIPTDTASALVETVMGAPGEVRETPPPQPALLERIQQVVE